MNQNRKKSVAVIGAGISGLACAYEMQKSGLDVSVYEQEPRVGGRMASREKDGLIFDIGADHLCDLYTEMKKYCAEFGIEWEKMRFLKYGIFKNGKIVSPDDAIGRLSKLRLAIQYLRTKKIGEFLYLSQLADQDTDNAYDFMKRRAGKEVADYFVDSFTSTYQFHRAREISLGALLGIMHSIQKDKDKWYLHRTKGGMSALPEAFASRLNVKAGEVVREVEASDSIVITANEQRRFNAAVIATPSTTTQKIYKNPTDKQRELLDATKYATTISVAVKVPKKILPEIAIVWVPFVESEKISGYVNEMMKGEECISGDDSLICTWLHEDFAKRIIDKSDEEIFSEVEPELRRVCPWITPEIKIELHDMQKWPQAMPKFAEGHLKRVEKFMRDGQGEQNVFFCGDYLNAPWTEGALRGGQDVARQVISLLDSGVHEPL